MQHPAVIPKNKFIASIVIGDVSKKYLRNLFYIKNKIAPLQILRMQ